MLHVHKMKLPTTHIVVSCEMRLCLPSLFCPKPFAFLGDFGIFEESLNMALPPPHNQDLLLDSEKSNHGTWESHNHVGVAKALGGEGFGVYDHVGSMVSHRFKI